MTGAQVSMRPERRVEILEAVCRVIAADGVDAIRSQRVAREAGVSPALPHYYYATLDDMVLAAFDLVEAREAERSTELRLPADPLAQLGAALAAAFAGSPTEVRERWILRAEFQRRALFDDAVGARERARAQADADRLADLVEAARAAGALPDRLDPSAIALRLAALRDGLGILLLLGIVSAEAARAQLEATMAMAERWQSTADVAMHRPPPEADAGPPAPPTDRREAVLVAVLELIAERGVRAVHFPDVAARAGVSDSLPRYYFPTIRGLIEAAFAYDAQRTQARVSGRVAHSADPLERLRDAYAYEVALGPERARPTWVLWSELVRMGVHDEAWRERAAGRLRDWFAYDAELIGQLRAAGRIGELDTEAVIVRLVAVLNGAGMQWMSGLLTAEGYADLLNHAIDDELGVR